MDEKSPWIHLTRLFSQDLIHRATGFEQVQTREISHDKYRLVHVNKISGSVDNILYELDGSDVWKHSESDMIVCLSPLAYEELASHPLYENRMTIIHHNLQSLLDTETTRLLDKGKRNWASVLDEHGPMSWFDEYHTYDETKAWYQDLAEKYPGLMTYKDSIGLTCENRSIFAVTITDKSTNIAPKKAIFLHGLQHAREWISGSTVNYIAYSLVSKFEGTDPDSYLITSLLRRVEFIIVPIVNPDGYIYTWTTSRLWRKNRTPSLLPLGTGVDLNRNWDDHWGVAGASSNPYSEIYMGPHAASEPEVKAMSQFFLNHTNTILAIDFHSYSQLVLWPYGYTERYYKFHKEHRTAANIISTSISNISGKDYRTERICDLYLASGNSVDFYSSEKILDYFPSRPYTFTIELRPALMDPRGFILGPEEIAQTGHEILNSLLTCITYVQRNPLKEELRQ